MREKGTNRTQKKIYSICGKRRIKNAFQTQNEILARIRNWNIYREIDIVFEALKRNESNIIRLIFFFIFSSRYYWMMNVGFYFANELTTEIHIFIDSTQSIGASDSQQIGFQRFIFYLDQWDEFYEYALLLIEIIQNKQSTFGF